MEDITKELIPLWKLTDSWDALGPSFQDGDDEDDTSGRVWRVQAHAKNSISCMKVDPVAGSSVSWLSLRSS